MVSDAESSIRIGVCAMEKKARSRPMQEILNRLQGFGFRVEIFDERAIVEDPIESWPVCDCLIAFFSTGFPLAKAEEYSELRRPYVVNDLHSQWLLMDRAKIYELLDSVGVPTPKHVVLDHRQGGDQLVDFEDHVMICGQKLKKPLVEKPLDGDDHCVYIYWPRSSGGGCTRLFRKTGDRASEYDASANSVRTDGTYIYEEFVQTQGVDVKVYTCGPEYAHAEARKAPAVDGLVRRNQRGKEERYPVILSEEEKKMARKVVLAIKQNICGLDLLRSKTGSVVCDVNGWSFVKDSTKYWDDTAQSLRALFLSARALRGSGGGPPGSPLVWCSPPGYLHDLLDEPGTGMCGSRRTTPDISGVDSDPTRSEELRCVCMVVRHADRTPKQKMKMVTSRPEFLSFCSPHGEVKVKQAAHLASLMQTTKALLQRVDDDSRGDGKPGSDSPVRTTSCGEVLGKSPGEAGAFGDVSVLDDAALASEGAKTQSDLSKEELYKVNQLSQVLDMQPLGGVYRKVQFKPKKVETEVSENGDACSRVKEALLILKWGGQLTPWGMRQALELGHASRVEHYPACETKSLLRLHATYRHDLKIYSSEEGRVQMTAAAFAKGLLDLEGHLAPIASMMIHTDETTTEMLDDTPEAGRAQMDHVKKQLSDLMHAPAEEAVRLLDGMPGREAQLAKLGASPHELMQRVQRLLTKLVEELAEKLRGQNHEHPLLIHGVSPANHSASTPLENLSFVYHRYHKLQEEFMCAKKACFDISKIPDIYDCSLYDTLHNGSLELTTLPELHETARALASFLVPLEYGITTAQKAAIGTSITASLLSKLEMDISSATAEAELDADDWQMEALGWERWISGAKGVKTPTMYSDRGSKTSKELYQLDRSAVNTADIHSLSRRVHTRLYFTSESHIISLLNVLRWGHEHPEAQEVMPSGFPGADAALRAAAEGAVRCHSPSADGREPQPPRSPVADEGACPPSAPPEGRPPPTPAASLPLQGCQRMQPPQPLEIPDPVSPPSGGGAPLQPFFTREAEELFDSVASDGMAFLTHLIVTVHESFAYHPEDTGRFRVRLLFSPGAPGTSGDVRKAVPLTPPEGLPLPTVSGFLKAVLRNEEAPTPLSRDYLFTA